MLRVLPEAEEELVDAAAWYETRRAGLGVELYVVFFRDSGAVVEIMAVAHAKRRPGYWLGRAR
jgi:hypothetical protein